jgi:hypothetical protein
MKYLGTSQRKTAVSMAKYSIITTDVTDVISSLFQKKLE